MKRGGIIDVLMGEVENENNPVNGAIMNRRKDVVHPEKMIDMLWFEPTTTEDVPHGVLRAGEATKALELLQAHGVQMRQITAPVRGVEQFTITSNTQRPANRSSSTPARTGCASLDGTWQAAPADVTVPAGAWVVADEPAARAPRVLPARADVGRRPHDVELSGRSAEGREDVSDLEGRRGRTSSTTVREPDCECRLLVQAKNVGIDSSLQEPDVLIVPGVPGPYLNSLITSL